ncbi:MAG TPA: hypothetical protein VER98_19260 [Terriglobia bacterium]|nr:hypothetical protein [Terriglobia bacterium]
MKTISSIVAVCENKPARDDAVKFCDELMHRFWANREFDITWLLFNDLAEEALFGTATLKAASADLIIFSMCPGCEISRHVRSWVEAWLSQRGEREGAIVGLRDPGHLPGGGVSQNFVYLHSVAHRAGLDYLTELPEKITHTIPDQLESYSERARQVTSVLDQILHQKPAPSAFRA